MMLKDKIKLRQELFRFLRNILDENDFGEEVEPEEIEKRNDKIKKKFGNITGKTGPYSVPDELFQRRTPRKNRVLISWKKVKEHNLTIDQLESFSGGVVVEFVNNDFFVKENKNDSLFIELKNRLGGDETVSSIITIRSESGSSSSQEQRDAYKKLINNTVVVYKKKLVSLNEGNIEQYYLERIVDSGKKGNKKQNPVGIGNEKWCGFLFISIGGGNPDTIKSHKGQHIALFNPACEYASEEVSEDINLVMCYFALKSIRSQSKQTEDYNSLLERTKILLKETIYDTSEFKGSLLDYCEYHPSIKFSNDGYLCDPIQMENIDIKDFSVYDKSLPEAIDFTHNEAVLYEKYYWDKERKQILSPSRPTNVFWSKHLSNMMQQNFTLETYFDHEDRRVSKRNNFYNSKRKTKMYKLNTKSNLRGLPWQYQKVN